MLLHVLRESVRPLTYRVVEGDIAHGVDLRMDISASHGSKHRTMCKSMHCMGQLGHMFTDVCFKDCSTTCKHYDQ